ncbi:MAG: phosphodiesterase [Kiritimatiellae bacterium]|nr:phosphodiesterase [Kiritimatiellia bacterium]
MSRILFFSDSHGVAAAMKALRARVEADAPDLVCFLGDALYHGPRNGVPLDYDTKVSADEFNAMAERIVAVRGNCDAEIDQYMLSFPLLGTYATVVVDGVRLFLSHGHLWGPDEQLPPLPAGTIVATGHTHVPAVELVDGHWCFNPGSISIPKGGSEPSYALLDGRILTIRRRADGATLRVANLA